MNVLKNKCLIRREKENVEGRDRDVTVNRLSKLSINEAGKREKVP